MANNKTKILQEKNFEEFQLVNQNGGQYAGISEKDVTARQIKTIDKTGKEVKVWRLYANNVRIATINASGKIVLSEEYKELLKNEHSIGADGKTIQGERWLQAMVPLKDRFSGKDIEDMKERSSRDIEKINMEERIKEEEYKNNRKNIIMTKGDKKVDEQNKMQPNKQQPKPAEVEKSLGLPDGDIETCTLIKDKRFYDNVPEARQANGLCMLAYSKSRNEYITVSIDENGKCNQLDTVTPSKSTTQATTEIRKGNVDERAVGNVMEVKGNPNVAYGVRINNGSNEMEFSELRIDRTEQGNNKYISTEMITSTQRPSERDVDAFNLKNNPSVSDEKDIKDDFEKAGVQVTRVESLTEEGRNANEILTIDEVKERISRKPDEVKEAVMDEIKGMEAHDITQNTIKEIVDEKEEELAKEQNDENKQRTPWGDAEERDAKRRA